MMKRCHAFSFSYFCFAKENNNRELIGKTMGTIRFFIKKISNLKNANTYNLLKEVILRHFF